MKSAVFLLIILAVVGIAAVVSFRTAPKGDLGDSDPADVLVVFGSPTDIDGSPLPMQMWRVHEAVAEYRRGRAPHVLFTGGPAANKYVESDVMAEQAVRLGLPADTLSKEGTSTTTLENLRGIQQAMQAHGWTRAELISSPEHLPRIGVLFRHVSFHWRVHPAPTPGRGWASNTGRYTEEAVATLAFRTFGSSAEPVIHAIAKVEHSIGWAARWVAYRLHNAFAAIQTKLRGKSSVVGVFAESGPQRCWVSAVRGGTASGSSDDVMARDGRSACVLWMPAAACGLGRGQSHHP